MHFKHTNRPGFLLGFIDFFTAGLFFLFYMPFGGLQDELDSILGYKTQRYWKAYLFGIPTLFIYNIGMDGKDRRRTESQGERAGCRRPVYILAAYVWLEHIWNLVVRPCSCHSQVFQHIE